MQTSKSWKGQQGHQHGALQLKPRKEELKQQQLKKQYRSYWAGEARQPTAQTPAAETRSLAGEAKQTTAIIPDQGGGKSTENAGEAEQGIRMPHGQRKG